MRIKSLNISSYGSFQSSGEIKFEEGLNLIVGQNNAGKSLILSSLKLRLENKPFKSSEIYEPYKLAPSSCDVHISLLGSEIEQAIFQLNGAALPIPTECAQDVSYFRHYLTSADIGVSIRKQSDVSFQAGAVPSVGPFASGWTTSHLVQKAPDQSTLHYLSHSNAVDGFVPITEQVWATKVFYFAPQRYNSARTVFGRYEKLAEDAQNIAGVLSFLIRERRSGFEKIVADMRDIFPSVQNITVTNRDTGM